MHNANKPFTLFFPHAWLTSSMPCKLKTCFINSLDQRTVCPKGLQLSANKCRVAKYHKSLFIPFAGHFHNSTRPSDNNLTHIIFTLTTDFIHVDGTHESLIHQIFKQNCEYLSGWTSFYHNSKKTMLPIDCDIRPWPLKHSSTPSMCQRSLLDASNNKIICIICIIWQRWPKKF